MSNLIQHCGSLKKVRHEIFHYERRVSLPADRVATLQQLVEMVTTGRPIDNSLVRNLEYNDFENMPLFKKGLDLADISRIAKENGATLDQLQDEIDKAQANQKGKENLQKGDLEKPEKVE